MFYGWWVVLGVFLSQMMVTGFYTYAFSLLVLPLEAEFEASRSDIMAGPASAGLLGVFLPLFIGPLVDRWSACGLMTIGAFIFAMGFFSLSYATSSFQFVIIFAIAMSLANSLMGPMTGSTLVARWFDQRRGFALGIAALGTSVGGLLIPIIMGNLIEGLGWRQAMQWIGGFVLLIVFPYVFLVLRNSPAEMGLRPDGAIASVEQSNTVVEPEAALDSKAIIKMPAYWLLSIALGLLFTGYSAMMANLRPYVSSLGEKGELSPMMLQRLEPFAINEATMLMLPVIAIFGFCGKIVFGSLADRAPLKVLLACSMAFTALALLLLSTQPGVHGLVLASVLLGLSAGGMLPVWGALLPHLFGLASYGRVMGLMMPIIAITTSIGLQAMGLLYDQTLSYELATQVFAGLVLVAMMLLGLVRR